MNSKLISYSTNLNFGFRKEDMFTYAENFLRMTFPNEWDLSEDEENLIKGKEEDIPQVTIDSGAIGN